MYKRLHFVRPVSLAVDGGTVRQAWSPTGIFIKANREVCYEKRYQEIGKLYPRASDFHLAVCQSGDTNFECPE